MPEIKTFAFRHTCFFVLAMIILVNSKSCMNIFFSNRAQYRAKQPLRSNNVRPQKTIIYFYSIWTEKFVNKAMGSYSDIM